MHSYAFKVSFSITFFFACMGLLTAGASDNNGDKSGMRACIHSGFWFFKLVLILSLIVATFVVPISHLVSGLSRKDLIRDHKG